MSGFQNPRTARPRAFGHLHGRKPRGAGFPHGRHCHYCGGKVSSATSRKGQAVIYCHGLGGNDCGIKHGPYLYAICEPCSAALWRKEVAKS